MPVGTFHDSRIPAADYSQLAGAEQRTRGESGTVKGNHMKSSIDESRRRLLKGLALVSIAAVPVRIATAADLAPVSPDDPTAKALKYVSDVSQAHAAKPGSKCANCKLYQGAETSSDGGCLLFPGKSVKAAAWCSSWTARS